MARWRLAAWVAAVFMGSVAFAGSSGAAHAQSRPVRFHDLVTGFPGSTLSLSPNETILAVESNGYLVLLAYPSGRLLYKLGDGILPRWSPAGDKLAFYSTRSGVTQLWIWSRGGRVRQLTTFTNGVDPDVRTSFAGYDTDALSYSWSPNGREIAFASRVAVTGSAGLPNAPLVLTNSTDPKFTTIGVCALVTFCAVDLHLQGRQMVQRPIARGKILVNQVFVGNVNTGEVTRITRPNRIFYDPIWTKDGTSVIAASVAQKRGIPTDVWNAYGQFLGSPDDQVVKIDPVTRSFSILIDNAGAARQLQLPQQGTTLYYITSTNGFALTHLATADVTGSRAHAAFWAGTPDAIRSLSSGSLGVIYRKAGKDTFAELRGNAATPLDDYQFAMHEVEPDGLSRDRKGGIVWINLSSGNVQHLASGTNIPTTLFRFEPANLELGKSTTITWKNHRGDTLTGSLLYPLHYIAGRRYPLIVDAYPLTRASGWMHTMGGNQTWAAAGYMTFMPGERAPHAWMNAANRAFGDAGKGPNGWNVALDDVMSGIGQLTRRGLIDPNRMCLYGHSNGGGAVSYLVTMTHRFKCAVVVAPALSDWITPAVLKTGGREDIDQFSGGYDFDRDIGDFIRMSSVYQLYKARTPMLIADGDDDGEFLLNSIEVYNAVRDTGTPVTFVRYPGQGHVFTGAAMHDFWKRQMAFFAKYLQP